MERKPLSPLQATQRLEALCVRAERSTGELAKKLAGWGITGAQAQEIISGLTSRRFVDDRRFARSFVHDKFEYSHWGRQKIKLHLRQKGIPGDIAAEALAEAIEPVRYRALLVKLLRSRLDSRTAAGDEARTAREKAARLAISRGFEPALVFEVLRGL